MNYSADDFTDLIVSSAAMMYLSDKRIKLPGRYLDYARADLLEGRSDRHHVNAFSNAKRSLHCQVDILIKAIGANTLKKYTHANFPVKIELLQKCSIVSPAILKSMNALRNKLEHDYLVPTMEETNTFLDVVELFLAATAKLTKTFPMHVQLTDDPEDGQSNRRVVDIEKADVSGLLEIKWVCLEVDQKAFSKEYRKELSGLKDSSTLTDIQKKRIAVKGLKRTAWDSIFKKLAVRGSMTVEVANTDEYCSWLKLLLKAA